MTILNTFTSTFCPEECEIPTSNENKAALVANGFLQSLSPTGTFALVNVSPELYEFLGFTDNRRVSCHYVICAVLDYVKSHGLQHPQKSGEFVPDSTLVNLFNLGPDDTSIKYQFIRNHLQPHFYNHKV
jgi:chromatin remodeling complex protein RSC6